MGFIILLLLALVLGGPVSAQTYLGVLTVPANTGPGGSCCSDTKLLSASNAAVPTDGTCNGCTVITQTQYNAYQTAAGALTMAAQAVAAANTLTITGCTTFTNLNNATFSISSSAMEYLNSLRTVFKVNGVTFPTATAVPTITDVNGPTAHLIATLAEFTALDNILSGYYWALHSYLAKVTAGQSPTLPSTTSTTYGAC